MNDVRLRNLGLAFSVLGTFACTTDGGSNADAAGDTTGTGSTTTSTDTTDDAPTATTDTDATSTGTTGLDATGTSDTDGTTGEVDETPADCAALPAGPFEAVPVFDDSTFEGAEDLAFDGAGNIVVKDEGQLVAVNASGDVEVLVEQMGNVNATLGLRYRSTGELVAAHNGRIVSVSTVGDVVALVENLEGPNGVYVDFDDNVWFTELGGGEVHRLDASDEDVTVVRGQAAASANGVLFDTDRSVLFFTNWSRDTVRRVAIDDDGAAIGEAEVLVEASAGIDGPDGLTMDACGNLYVVAHQQGQVYRLVLGADGEVVGEPEALLPDALGANALANAQFGSGEGWSDSTLYVIGRPGTLYAVDVGVQGKPYPVPQ